MNKAPKEFIEWYEKDHNSSFIVWFVCTTFITVWPWVFFGVVAGLGGMAMPYKAAKITNHHPQDVSYFVTAICSVLNLVIGILFSEAVSGLAKKYVVHKDPHIAHISFFANLKNRSPPMSLIKQGRIRPVLIVVLYIVMFIFVTSSFTVLLTPVIFNCHA